MKIGQLVNKVPVTKLHKSSTLLVDSSTLLGAEIEVENCVKFYDQDSEPKAGYWTHKADHSLRNNGREFVFAEPLYGADAVDAIDFICQKAYEYNWKVSVLTGIHTHVDVREMEMNPFRNLCVVYSLTEPLIYNWVGDGRSRNIFCMPWYMAEGDLETISEVLKQKYSKEMSCAYISKLNKYSGLNFGSLTKFGTVEFRMLRTTFNKNRIIDWFNILLSLKKYAMSNAEVASDKLYNEARQKGAFQFACDVFGKDLVSKMWYPGYSRHMISLGGPIADWFIDNGKDIFLKNGSIFDWVRHSNLRESEDEQGTHPGYVAFQQKNKKITPEKPPVKQAVLSDEEVLKQAQMIMKKPKKVITKNEGFAVHTMSMPKTVDLETTSYAAGFKTWIFDEETAIPKVTKES
jgi:hypothetical protein